ncbi:MAG: hypothetical protein Q9169_007188 [Polycauliona sp. 2 TL-2023]
MDPISPPKITAQWSLNRTTHSFSTDTSPPILTISLYNQTDRPITIYNESIDPWRLLARGLFTIFDLTTDSAVDQTKTHYCDFEPPSKIHVPLREHLFHTLYPSVPVTFSGAFGRSRKLPPQPASMLEESEHARGVHGLEIGHEYVLRPGKWWGWVRWWEYGERDEVMNPKGKKLNGRTLAYNHTKVPHPGFSIDVESLPEIHFSCVE